MIEFPVNTKKIREIEHLLKWYANVGVETAVNSAPTNWLSSDAIPNRRPLERLKLSQNQARSVAINSPINKTTQPNVREHTPPTPINNTQTAPLSLPSIERANELAAKAHNLDELQTALEAFDGCSLKRTAKNLVFYRGAEKAPLMIIGEAPGRDEDIAGKPFVGRAGQLLDKMLAAIGHNEENTHITNIVYWRPPGNRTPTLEEGQLCRPFLDRQIELVAPKLIMFVGGAAAKQILETSTGIMKLRGKWKNIDLAGKERKTIATLHPAYLLRTPIAKRLAWQDLQILKTELDNS